MKILLLCILLLVSIQVNSVHLRWRGGFAGRILMRAYSDPAVQEAVKNSGSGDRSKIRQVIATKIGQIVQKDPTALQRLAEASFPGGYLGKVSLTKQQKIKLLKLAIKNPQLQGKFKKGEFLQLISKQQDLKNVYQQLTARRNAFIEVKQKLIQKVKADPSVAPFLANGTKRYDPEFRKAFKQASAKIIKADPELQKVVAKSRFGFDPVFSQLNDQQRVKLLNLLLDSNKTQTLRWKSPEYLRAVSDTIQAEPSFKDFYEKNKDALDKKIKVAQERKAKWLARRSGKNHFQTFEDLVDAGVQHFLSTKQ